MIDCFSDYLKTLETYATAAQQSDLVQEVGIPITSETLKLGFTCKQALANVYGVLLDFFREARLVFVNERGIERSLQPDPN